MKLQQSEETFAYHSIQTIYRVSIVNPNPVFVLGKISHIITHQNNSKTTRFIVVRDIFPNAPIVFLLHEINFCSENGFSNEEKHLLDAFMSILSGFIRITHS